MKTVYGTALVGVVSGVPLDFEKAESLHDARVYAAERNASVDAQVRKDFELRVVKVVEVADWEKEA